jgi:hypothetical protein
VPYAIRYSLDAMDDLAKMRAFDRAKIMNEVRKNLIHQPTVITRHRKPVTPTPDLAIAAAWELQVDAWRVLYDIEPGEVLIIRVIFKGTKALALAQADATKNEEEDE